MQKINIEGKSGGEREKKMVGTGENGDPIVWRWRGKKKRKKQKKKEKKDGKENFRSDLSFPPSTRSRCVPVSLSF